MKASLLYSATLFASAAFAFPRNLFKNDISDETLAQITELAANITQTLAKPQIANTKRQFDADAQRVDTTGDHAYVCLHSSDRRYNMY
jgi:hypothetical protein